MKFSSQTVRWSLLGVILNSLVSASVFAQAMAYARTYQKSKDEVESALKDMQAYSGQRLPIIDGFVATGATPLDRYERAFCQFSIDLLPGTPGSTVVRVTAKITAWYADKDPSKSGYQVLTSNGRLELDLLGRLEEKFGGKPSSAATRSISDATITAPKPKLDLTGVHGSAIPSANSPSSDSEGARGDELSSLRTQRETEQKRMQELNTELQSLQEIKKNQAHPLNLVVVKKSRTAVLTKPAEGSRVLFNAAVEDEFEFLEAEGEWIHVQISGASRGYIRRSNLELPELIAARLNSLNGTSPEQKPAAFRVVREEDSAFPGDWEPLKGKEVKIYTVQPASQDSQETGPAAKRLFAGALFQKYAFDTQTSASSADGVAVIFDSADGGIMAATLPNVKQFAAGAIPSDIFWKQCYFDPPDAFDERRKP
jgi:hypothetical protein